ncbi:MAG: hypothetical protein ABSH22_14645 [Tepidisphaeraceae bacterium]|jgi:hypothetical protein
MQTPSADAGAAGRRRPEDFKDLRDLRRHFAKVADGIRSGQINVIRSHYALSLMHGVMQAICCGYPRITAIELGVANGDGLIALRLAAEFLQLYSGIEIDVFGFDTATGLPPPADYRDHPELWTSGEFAMPDPNAIRSKMADPSKHRPPLPCSLPATPPRKRNAFAHQLLYCHFAAFERILSIRCERHRLNRSADRHVIRLG